LIIFNNKPNKGDNKMFPIDYSSAGKAVRDGEKSVFQQVCEKVRETAKEVTNVAKSVFTENPSGIPKRA
jgi:hypothetical protein